MLIIIVTAYRLLLGTAANLAVKLFCYLAMLTKYIVNIQLTNTYTFYIYYELHYTHINGVVFLPKFKMALKHLPESFSTIYISTNTLFFFSPHILLSEQPRVIPRINAARADVTDRARRHLPHTGETARRGIIISSETCESERPGKSVGGTEELVRGRRTLAADSASFAAFSGNLFSKWLLRGDCKR